MCAVHNYSNESRITKSAAVVELYTCRGLSACFRIPALHDVNGDGWEDVVLGNEVTEAPGAEQCFATTYVVRRFADAEGVSGFLVSPGLCGSSESQVEGQQRGGILPLPPGLGRLAVHHARTAGGRAWAPARFPHDGAARPRNSRYFSYY